MQPVKNILSCIHVCIQHPALLYPCHMVLPTNYSTLQTKPSLFHTNLPMFCISININVIPPSPPTPDQQPDLVAAPPEQLHHGHPHHPQQHSQHGHGGVGGPVQYWIDEVVAHHHVTGGGGGAGGVEGPGGHG